MRIPDRFSPLRSKRDHAQVNAQLARLFRARGAKATTVRLREGPVKTWVLPELDIWLAAHALPNRYRNALGPGDPVGRRNLWPSVQLNLALAPGSARPQARFVRDETDRIWVAHSGTLGGRQPGISRHGFVALLGGARTVRIGEASEELVILGTFAEPIALLDEIARLTHTAHEYRGALAAGLQLSGPA